MYWTQLHAEILKKAFEDTLGQPKKGTVAFVRCLMPDVVLALAADQNFNPENWKVLRVGEENNNQLRTITAGQSVELREKKFDAILLLVDTTEAGAGMDGIYSASLEVGELELFTKALALAYSKVTMQLSRDAREYAERALRKAKGYGQRFSISSWTEFDFLVRISAEQKDPGEFLYLLGLWPVKNKEDDPNLMGGLDISRLFVNRLLGTDVAGLTPLQRIDSLKLDNSSPDQIKNLEKFLLDASTRPIYLALAELEQKTDLWVNALKIANQATTITRLELGSWRKPNGTVLAWSGLKVVDQESPIFQLDFRANDNRKYSKLEVRWEVWPVTLGKGDVAYRVAIVSDMDEEIASREILHPGTSTVKARFSDDDFSLLPEDALIHAKIKVSVLGNDNFEPQSSEEFKICFGEQTVADKGSGGTKVRTLSEGVIDFDSRELIAATVEENKELQVDSKDFVLFHSQGGKRFKVPSPPLFREVESQWAKQSGAIGRWRVKVRASGSRASVAEFVPYVIPESASGNWQKQLDRVTAASGKFVDRFKTSGVGQMYDIKSKVFENIKEYIIAWMALLEVGDPLVALANTVEVQSLSGETIGLIVLPSHPLRVAWHAAYDNLVLHAKFEEKMKPKDIREEFALLDGAMFPPFLPGLTGGKSFVFADTLGFHAVGMIPEDDKEPKASVALLARALGEKETAESVPTVGKQSAKVLSDEILSYIECHDYPRLLLIHALRAGDGLTVAKALGVVQCHLNKSSDGDDDDLRQTPTAFVLDFYPSDKQCAIAGRFIAETREKRRSGAGSLSDDDRWMLESVNVSGGVSLPKLRWARKNDKPKTAAHLAIAFDTFESQVVPNEKQARTRPPFAFGLLSFFVREYTSFPSPVWKSLVIESKDGNKHPAGGVLTKWIAELQGSILDCVSKNINANAKNTPVLRTEISPEKADSLRDLHLKCDWVITLDRNAGVEYFDSPRDNKGVYDAFVIDCVPEREDLGCLQLITSTSNLDEVRNLLDGSLDQMGLSRSRKNAEFLLENLKALSGRLAIRLTGQKAPASELIALALCQSNCWQSDIENECWASLLNGFMIPVDDVRDILPPLKMKDDKVETDAENNRSRPDIIFVSIGKKGLLFQFIEVKYRRHLRTARTKDLLDGIKHQVESLRQRWENYYLSNEISKPFQAIRRAKLARVLYFYADKARRHADDEAGGGISTENHAKITAEIDKMIDKGNDYSFSTIKKPDRGWIFCPECAETTPVEISPSDWETRIFLFGPGPLSGSILHRDKVPPPPIATKAPAETYSLKVQPINDQASSPPTIITGDTLKDLEQESQTHDPASREMEKTLVPSTSDQRSQTHDPASREMEKTLVPFASDNVVPSVVCLGQDLYTGSDVQWQLAIKGNPHLLLVGLPGMGKTTCLLNLCQQMLEKGITPIVFSYHDDIDKRLIEIVGPVRFVDFDCLGFNPLQVIDRQSRNAYLDVAGVVRDIFVAIYPELGDIQGESVRDAIKQSFKNAGWGDLNANLAQLQEPPFGEFLEILQSIEKPNKGLQTLLARLGELEDYQFFKMAEHPTLSLWEDSKQPIVIRIHRTQNSNLQQAFASLVFYKFYKDMFRRGTQSRITHAIIFDEAHKAARLNLISTMAKECRKFGIALILASQEAKDFNSSLFSAIANYLVLRVTEADAKALVRNVSSADQEKSLIDKIKGLEKFKAMFFCEGRPKPTILKLNNV